MSIIGCAGLLVADTFCGPMPELPREGQLLAIEAMSSSAGGCAANVAFDLKRQGLEVELAGCVGHDAAAAILMDAFEAENIGCARVAQVETHPTSQTVILLVDGQDRRYIHVFGANAALETRHFDREWLRGLTVFYLGGLFALPGLETGALADVLAFCHESGVLTVVDVVVPQGFQADGAARLALEKLLPHTDYFLPNDDEAIHLTGHADTLSQLRAFREMGANTVILTRGTAGAIAAQGDDYWQAAAYEMDAVDPSGSGDAFASGIIYGITQKWEMSQILRYATAVGGSATLAVGTTGSVFHFSQAQAYIEAHPLQIVRGQLESGTEA